MDLKAQAPCFLSSLSSLNRNCHYTPPHKFCPNLPAVSRRRLAPATMGSAKEYHLSVRSLHLKVEEDVPGSLGEGGHHLPHASQVCPSQRCRQPVVGQPDFRSIARTTLPPGKTRNGVKDRFLGKTACVTHHSAVPACYMMHASRPDHQRSNRRPHVRARWPYAAVRLKRREISQNFNRSGPIVRQTVRGSVVEHEAHI